MSGEEDEQKDRPTRGRPCFSRTEAPIGIYNGEQAIIVYDLRPLPPWPKHWMRALGRVARGTRTPGLPRNGA